MQNNKAPSRPNALKEEAANTQDQQLIKIMKTELGGDLSDRLQEKLLENARLKRSESHSKLSSSISELYQNKPDEIETASSEPDSTPSGSETASVSAATATTSESPDETSAEPKPNAEHPTTSDTPANRSNPRTHIYISMVGAIIIFVVLINSWYLGSRIDNNSQRITQEESKPIQPTVIAQPPSSEIDRLLALANDAYDLGRLTNPAGQNALDYYRVAIQLEPDNQIARAGLRAITDQLLFQAESALRENRLEEVKTALMLVRDIDPGLPLLNILEAHIEQQQKPAKSSKSKASHEKKPASSPAISDTTSPAKTTSPTKEEKKTTTHKTIANVTPIAPEIPTTTIKKTPDITPKENLTGTVSTEATAAPIADQLPKPPPTPTATAEITQNAATENINRKQQPPTTKAADNAAEISPVELKRIKSVQPRTPRAAIRRGLDGWAEVAFTVTEAGLTTDWKVTASEPGETFDKAAIDAVKQWRFEPPIRDGEPVSQETKVRFKFMVSD